MKGPALLLLTCLVAAATAGCLAPRPATTARDLPGEHPSYDWELPRGFPTPWVPPDNPMTAAKVRLGRHLLYDERLSLTGDHACSSCHRQELAFTDGRARALGSTGELHPRSSMALANVAYNASFSWADPDLRRLEDQAHVPMFNKEPVELGLAGVEPQVLDRFRSDPAYVAMFAESFPNAAEPIGIDNVARAIASFERTLISGNSPYDRWVYHGEREAMPETARRGMKLFFSRELRCSRCHAGFNLSGPVVFDEATEIEPTFHNTGLYDVDGDGAYPGTDQGLFEISGRDRDRGRFRAPSLRNVELTAPYMHDGSVATLEEVVAIYAAGGRREPPLGGDGRRNRNKSDRVRGFELDAGMQADLVAFLESLTDESLVTDRRFSDPSVGALIEQSRSATDSPN